MSTADDEILRQIDSRRHDQAFMARLAHMLVDHADLLRTLRDGPQAVRSKYAMYDVHGHCEVLHLGYPAVGDIISTQDTERGIAAYVAWPGGAGWLFRSRPNGLPDQWRPSDA